MGAFKTKARAIELLGKKQIRDSVTALAEIMKNAHDADAGLLRVEFLTKQEQVPCIVICDTGVGMDREDLENKWFVLGTSSKFDNREKKSPGGRILMGEKGIGRLAISRLGQQMWMFTKKKNTGWNIVYINWNIFENPDLFIEDINIPVSYDGKLSQISEITANLEKMQTGNLKSASWKTPKNVNKKKLIEKQIKESRLDEELIDDFCSIIEENGVKQGTVIFSLNLNDDWDRYLDPDTTADMDMLAVRNYNRLNAFITDFGTKEPDFQVELFHNGKSLEFSSGFTEEDYEIYDLRIQGSVEHGLFQGHIDARNADSAILNQCNEILKKGITVTAGIRDWENEDCGKYEVKFCHFEMDKKNTGLTFTEWNLIKQRMDKAGGIGVYRDNVRVLPYGEPDNDFLELEMRRSKSATFYLFSHRNMFGRIDITSLENPHLEDKSSREGFIENQYYNYFIRTIQNLLVRIAVEFAGEMNKNSFKLRRSYLNYNNKKKKEQIQIQEFEKEQERLLAEDSARAERLLKENIPKLTQFEEEIQKRLKALREIEYDSYTRYNHLIENERKVKSCRYGMEGYISDTKRTLHISINERLESRYEPQLLERIDMFDERLEDVTQSSAEEMRSLCEYILNLNHLRLQAYHEDFEKQTGAGMDEVLSDVKEYLDKTRTMLAQMAKEAQDHADIRYDKLMQKADRIRDYEQDILKFKRESSEIIYHGLCAINLNLDAVEYAVKDPGTPQELIDARDKISAREEEIYSEMEQAVRNIEERYAVIDSRLDEILCRYDTDDASLIRQLTTRNNELKQLNDMYADLANLGMAAEIVSHEFNQMFHNIYDAVNQLRFQGVSKEGRYYLNQIDIGFRSVSDRLSQMSPMYRSRSMYKKKVNIHDMLEDVHSFFESRMQKQSVKFINDVPRELVLKISLSKIYPVISNLFYNSLYWMADKKNRMILVRYEKAEEALYVEDSGEGIAVRNKERVFEPFFSLKKDGRGLGLAISRNVLEAQGHKIEAVTEPESKCLEGACFKITFGTEEGE